MSIFQPVDFNPVSLFTSFAIDENVLDQQFAEFQNFDKPENRQQRQEERDERASEILALSGQILSDLRKQCLLEKEERIIELPDGTVIIKDGVFDDCLDCSENLCLLEAVPESGLIFNTLIDEFNKIQEKNSLDLFEPETGVSGMPNFPLPNNTIDQELIDKYDKLISDWSFHVLSKGIFVPLPGQSIPITTVINPLIITPSLTKVTATTLYSERIKPYNEAHQQYLEGVIAAFEEYNSEEAKEERLKERLERRGQISGQIDELETILQEEKSKFEEAQTVTETESGDVIFVSEEIQEPTTFDDGFSFTQGQLDRIKLFANLVQSALKDFASEDYLTAESLKMNRDIEIQIFDRIFEKSKLLKELNNRRINLINVLQTIDAQTSQTEQNIVAVILALMETSVEVYTDASNYIISLLNQIIEIYDRKIVVSSLNIAVEQSVVLQRTQLKSFTDRIIAIYPEVEDNNEIEFLINKIVNEKSDEEDLNILRELLAAERIVLQELLLNSDEDSGRFATITGNINRIEEALNILRKVQYIIEIKQTIDDLSEFLKKLPSFESEIKDADPTQNQDDLINRWEDEISGRYNELRAELAIQISRLEDDERESLKSRLEFLSEKHDNDVSVIEKSFELQQEQRQQARNDLEEDAKESLEEVELEIEKVEALPDDTEKIHSFSVIRQIADLLDNDRKVINERIEEEAKQKEVFLTLKQQKEKELEEALEENVVLITEVERLENEMAELESAINEINIVDNISFNEDTDNLIDELRFAITNRISELQSQIDALKFEFENPEFDPPFQAPPDPFDEVLNATRAILFGFMSHLVQYGTAVMTVAIPVFPFSTIDTGLFNPIIQSDSIIEPFAQKIAKELNSGGSIESIVDLPPTIIQKIVFGLFFQAATLLSTAGSIVGVTTGGRAGII